MDKEFVRGYEGAAALAEEKLATEPENGFDQTQLRELAELFDDIAALGDVEIIHEGMTYEEVLIMVEHSDIRGKKLDYTGRLTNQLEIPLPIMSAAMDTVTDNKTAVAMARHGGVGVIHKNFTPEEQAAEVEKVKRASSALIEAPRTLRPNQSVADFMRIRDTGIGSVMITDSEGTLMGMVTKRQLRSLMIESELLESSNGNQTNPDAPGFEDILKHIPLYAVMHRFSESELLPEGSTQEDAMRVFAQEQEVDRLPMVDTQGKLIGLYTFKDILERVTFPDAAKDSKERLMVGAAIGVGEDAMKRLGLLVEQEVDFIVVDSAHGQDQAVLDLVCQVKEHHPDLQVIAGNAASAKGTRALIDVGVDAVKVGIGGGSTCTTRPTTGVGEAQLSAIRLAVLAAQGDVPIIADGGIEQFGDIGKALVAGADCVMIGGKLAGHEESPGEEVIIDGERRKALRGMGSVDAIKEGSGGRYFGADQDEEDIVPEGMSGTVPYRGKLTKTLTQMKGSISKAMYYTGQTSAQELRKGRFAKLSSSAQRESHLHGMKASKGAPNYSYSV